MVLVGLGVILLLPFAALAAIVAGVVALEVILLPFSLAFAAMRLLMGSVYWLFVDATPRLLLLRSEGCADCITAHDRASAT